MGQLENSSDSFPRVTPRFAKNLCFGDKIVPATYHMKFNWFEFVRHEAGTQNDPNFNVASSALLLQTVPARKWT